MTYFTILLMYLPDTYTFPDDYDYLVFDSAAECSAAMPDFYHLDYELVCHRTDIPSGSIRPKARPKAAQG